MKTRSLSIKTIFFSLILVYILVISIALLRPTNNNISLTKAPRELSSLRINTTQPENPYRFLNPDLAYKILSQLDVLPTSLARTGYNSKDENPLPYLHLLKDDNYCEKHREYITHFPETIFTEMNVIMDGHPLTLVRNKVVAPIANDVQRYIGQHMPKNDTTLYDIKPQVTLFLTRERLFEEKRIGQHFSCLTQSSSAIPTRYILSKKDGFAEAVAEYAKQYADRPDCFNFQKVVPKTYLLYREQDCRDFFQVFNSPSYQTLKKERRIVYITKDANNKHMGSGVEPVNDKREAELREIYGNGALCGKVEDRFLVQNYIHNPLLLHGRKFDFRMYLLIASSNPYMAYYHDGFLRVSLLPYDVNSDDKKVLLTNLALSYQIYDDAKGGKFFEGMDEEALKHAQQWSCERLQDYLLETGVISDPNWLDNYLRPKIKKALAHLLRFSIKPMYEHSSVFQLIGMDFMLDEDLNLWYIEANSKPGLGAYSQPMEKFIVKMLHDELEIVTGLLRSRMKRIIRYVNKLMTNDSIQEAGNGEIVIKDVEKESAAFKKLSKNWFEKEFEPSPGNGWHKILDENYGGVGRYNGLIEERCL